MTSRTVRRLAALVFLVCVPGMIVTSITERPGAAITFGLAAAVAAVALLAVTAVETGRLGPDLPTRGSEPAGVAGGGAADAEEVERRVQALVGDGVDEAALRGLVRAAVALGRATRAGR